MQQPLDPNTVHAALADATHPALAFKPGEAVAPWQERVREKVRALLGYSTYNGPLEVESLWRREHALGSIEKIHFTAEPGCRVNGYVCLPSGARPPYRWMICLQGHSSGAHLSVALDKASEIQPIEPEGDRDFGIGCLRRGWAALCIDQRGFGERVPSGTDSGTLQACHEPTLHALLLGRTLNGERVLDVARCIDYLDTRRDVDREHLGVMGNSSGGTTALYAAALLPRLTMAMPSCAFCTFRACLLSIKHCLCNYVPDLYNHVDMADILGCLAPKPVVVVHGHEDEIFPIAATQAAFSRLREIYAAAGAEGHCRLVIGEGGHRFYAEEAWPVVEELTGTVSQ